MKKLSILLLFTILLLSCSSDDKNEEVSISFAPETPENISSYPGGQFVLSVAINGDQNTQLEHYSFYLGDLLIPQSNVKIQSVITNNINYKEVTIIIPDIWNNESGKLLSIRDSKGKTVATGPRVDLSMVYRFVRKAASAGLPNVKINALDGTNKVVTMVEREPGLTKKLTIEFKGYKDDNTANFEYGWQDLNFPSLDGATYVTTSSVELGRPYGFSTRDGITYVARYFKNRSNNLYFFGIVQEYKGMMNFCGEYVYDNPRISSTVTDLEQDKNNKLFYRIFSNPNAIYKTSEMESPQLWVGSETESSTKDGMLLNARFENVIAMDRDANDNLYIAQKNIIRKVTPQGEVKTLTKFKFEDIQAFAVAPDNRIYVLDKAKKSQIYVIDTRQENLSSHAITNGFSTETITIGETNNMAVSADGIIYFISYVGSGEYIYSALVPSNWKSISQ